MRVWPAVPASGGQSAHDHSSASTPARPTAPEAFQSRSGGWALVLEEPLAPLRDDIATALQLRGDSSLRIPSAAISTIRARVTCQYDNV